ncbi:MAG: DNA-3-methyladenine glycosylase 2 family protein [Burkholderiales bacterium]|nr:DNA-3-methyladenine glycosylase 2 family protein [Burkholderiales bacterium]
MAVEAAGDAARTPEFWRKATRDLGKRDPVLQKLIAAHPGLTLQSRGDAFTTLARAIVGQQISVKAAQSVWQKLVGAVTTIRPETIDQATPEQLRACGLSAGKASYLRDLARHFIDGSLRIGDWPQQDDETIIAELVQVKGIGRWTAEMFLMFYLMRPDVLPLDDLGLRRAMNRAYGGGGPGAKPLSLAEMRQIASNWQPWRSVATWYLWRSIEPVPSDY